MTSCNSTQATALLQHNYRNMAPHYFDPNTSGSNGFSHNLTCDNFMMNWIVEDKKRQIFQFLYVVTSATPSLWTSLPTGESGNNSFFFCISLNTKQNPQVFRRPSSPFLGQSLFEKRRHQFQKSTPIGSEVYRHGARHNPFLFFLLWSIDLLHSVHCLYKTCAQHPFPTSCLCTTEISCVFLHKEILVHTYAIWAAYL